MREVLSVPLNVEQRTYYCYGLLYPDGVPFYIGKGHGARISDHVKLALRGDNGFKSKVIRKIIRDGGEVGYIEFASGLNEEEAFSKEIEMIATIGRRPNGPLVNLTDGGDGTSGWQPTSATRAKIAASNKGHPVSPETIAKAVATRRARGSYVISDATKAKLSAATKGRKRPPETIAKMVATRRARGNYQHSEKAKAKMSAAHLGLKMLPESIAKWVDTRRKRGFWHSEKARAKLAATRMGTKHTDATRAKISATKTGSKLSKETRAKMAAAQSSRRARERAQKADLRAANLRKDVTGTPCEKCVAYA